MIVPSLASTSPQLPIPQTRTGGASEAQKWISGVRGIKSMPADKAEIFQVQAHILKHTRAWLAKETEYYYLPFHSFRERVPVMRSD